MFKSFILDGIVQSAIISVDSVSVNSTNYGWKTHWLNLQRWNPQIWGLAVSIIEPGVYPKALSTGRGEPVMILAIKPLLGQGLIITVNDWSGHCL